MKISVQGNKISLCKYKVIYQEKEQMVIQYLPTYAEAEKIAESFNGEITELKDVATDEWIDGIELPETNRPMEKALEIIAMGEEGYKKWLEQQAAQSPENLAAENAQLKQQLTDTQLALVEVYEMMLPS